MDEGAWEMLYLTILILGILFFGFFMMLLMGSIMRSRRRFQEIRQEREKKLRP